MIREWSDEVRLGMMRLLSCWSRVPGRPSRSPVRGRWKDEWVFKDGAILSLEAERLRSAVSVGVCFVWEQRSVYHCQISRAVCQSGDELERIGYRSSRIQD